MNPSDPARLHHLAAKVRGIGFQDIEVKEQPKLGIQAGGYFFPATELDSIVNVGFFVNGMFEAIAARREKAGSEGGVMADTNLNELHRGCMFALRNYIELAGRSCQLLNDITRFPVSYEQQQAIMQQRVAENEAHDRYQIEFAGALVE